VLKSRISHMVGCFGVLLFGAAIAHASPQDVQIPSRDVGSAIAVNNVIYFDFDSAVLDWQARQVLDEAVTWLRNNPGRELILEGHTDRRGTVEYNRELSFKRARSAKEYMVSRGIAASRVHVEARGERFPIDPADAGNRRVFFYATRGEEVRPARAEETTPAPVQETRVEVTVQPQPQPQPQPTATATATTTTTTRVQRTDRLIYVERARPVDERLFAPRSMSLSVGGGVTGFLDQSTRAYGATGGAWEARLTMGTRSPLSLEAAYVGSLQDLDATGLATGAMLMGHGVEGNLRLNANPRGMAQPYLFAGAGWTRYSVVNTDTNTSVVANEEDVMFLPVGIGFGWRWNGMVLDTRGTARMAFSNDLIMLPEEDRNGVGERSANLASWAISARVGWEF
jgi:outer membrane protein OmpA-like peptidoglycan-associated protein